MHFRNNVKINYYKDTANYKLHRSFNIITHIIIIRAILSIGFIFLSFILFYNNKIDIIIIGVYNKFRLVFKNLAVLIHCYSLENIIVFFLF